MTARIVEATIEYLGPCQGKPIFHGRRRDLDNLPLETRAVRIEDLRHGARAPSLDREGFTLVRHRTSAGDLLDAAARETHARELEELVKELTGATKAVALRNGIVRRSERSLRFGRDGTSVPGRFAHCDFSPNPAGSSSWVERLLPSDEARERLARRFAIYNVWRALSDPPQDTPLALCDARSVGALDAACANCVDDPAGGPELRFESCVFRYGARHRWCFFSDLTRYEVLVFKGYDRDPGRAGGVPHAAFDDPGCPPCAPPRESVDERVIAFFDAPR